MYALRTADLLPHLQKWNGDEQMPIPAARSRHHLAAAELPLPGGVLLFLSPDEALLAACSGPTVRFYSTQALLGGSSSTAELAQRTLPAKVLRLAFRPGAPAEFAALLAGGAVLLGSLGSAAPPVQLAAAQGVPATCLAWSADGSRLALGAGDEVLLFTHADGSWCRSAAVRVASQEVQADDQSLQVGIQIRGLPWGRAALASGWPHALDCRCRLLRVAHCLARAACFACRWTAWPGWRPRPCSSPASSWRRAARRALPLWPC